MAVEKIHTIFCCHDLCYHSPSHGAKKCKYCIYQYKYYKISNKPFIVYKAKTPASGLRLDILRLSSAEKLVGLKCFLYLIPGLNSLVGRMVESKVKFTKTSKWSETLIIPELVFLCSSQMFVYMWFRKKGVEFVKNLAGLLISEIQPQLARQSTTFVTFECSWVRKS